MCLYYAQISYFKVKAFCNQLQFDFHFGATTTKKQNSVEQCKPLNSCVLLHK